MKWIRKLSDSNRFEFSASKMNPQKATMGGDQEPMRVRLLAEAASVIRDAGILLRLYV